MSILFEPEWECEGKVTALGLFCLLYSAKCPGKRTFGTVTMKADSDDLKSCRGKKTGEVSQLGKLLTRHREEKKIVQKFIDQEINSHIKNSEVKKAPQS